VLALAAARASAQPPVWTIRGARGAALLFGSVHLLPTGLDWRPRALTQAVSEADELWFELPIDQATNAEAVRLASRRGILPRGERLSDHLTADQNARLGRVAASLGVARAGFETMRPWFAEVTLSLLVDERAGAAASQGVEAQIETVAPPTARRRSFETARQQIAFLADAAMADQVAVLDETLREIEERPDSYGRMVGEWMTGDLKGLAADALEPLRRASPTTYRRLITERNRRWAAALRRRLARPGAIVVVVGMGHLVGPDGVPALMKAGGAQVEGPD
nr:TraB/GumN family protein [Caulobacteraceae bacterium]